MTSEINLVKKRFGRLVVKKFFDTILGKRQWECDCDCGDATIVPTRDLTTGKTSSCEGCRGKTVQKPAAKRQRTNTRHIVPVD